MSFLKELLVFLKARKKMWLLPLIIIMVVWSWTKRQLMGNKIAIVSTAILFLVCV